jgi:hypothetical protein
MRRLEAPKSGTRRERIDTGLHGASWIVTAWRPATDLSG